MRHRIARTARRATALAVLGWLLAMAGTLTLASPASAAPTATVAIRDLTPPVVSVDAGGSVTFTNQIADKTVQVGGGLLPTLVSVTVHTDVTLRLPSGTKPLPAGASVTESFAQSCLTCSITYTYRLDSNASLTSVLTDAVLGQLPGLPAPTPFVVNTLLPLPNLPSVNLPSPPPVTLPAPAAPAPAPPVTPPTTGQPAPVDPGVPAPAPGAQPAPTEGQGYTYGSAAGAPGMAPSGTATAAGVGLDPRSARPSVDGRTPVSGSGGGAGTYDGASVPTFGDLAGLDGTRLDGSATDVDVASDAASTPADAALSVPALVAVVSLAAATAFWVRTRAATRSA